MAHLASIRVEVVDNGNGQHIEVRVSTVPRGTTKAHAQVRTLDLSPAKQLRLAADILSVIVAACGGRK